MSHAKIPLAGVIGSPISHSRSPRLHGHWLRHYGVQGHYIPMDIAEADLPELLRALPKAGFVGCNVTIPHKVAVLRLADVVTERAAQMGAANTLTFLPDGRIEADNTDGYGFIENLHQAAPDWRAEQGPAVIFGAGGAARAVISALLAHGAPVLRLTNRTRAKAEELREVFGPKVEVYDWAEAGALLEGARTVVNTTSLGMVGQPDFTIPLNALPQTALATDLVYVPLETPFLRAASAHGCQTVDGLGMLLHQAVPGFERWFGHRPEVTEALRQAVLA